MEPASKRQRLDYPAHHEHTRGFNDPYTYYEPPKLNMKEDAYDDDMIDDDDEITYRDMGEGYDPVADLQQKRAQLNGRLKSTFESIFEKYERDFDGIGDEIDLYTGKIVVNNGHLLEMENEGDAGIKRKSILNAFTGGSEEEVTSEGSEGSSQEEEGSEEDTASENDSGSEGEEAETASDDAMLEDDMILRGLRPKDEKHNQREPSLELGSANQRFLKGYEDARPVTTPRSLERNEAPIESDILAKFGPQIGPQVFQYISQQRLLNNDDTHIEPAWRAPSLPVQPTPNSMMRPRWDVPAIPLAPTSIGRRPILHSILAQREIERTPSPGASTSVWASGEYSIPRSSVGPRKSRCAFTAEDDDMILETVTSARLQGIHPRSKSIWDQLELNNPRHTAFTWKKRYYDKRSGLASSFRDDSELPVGNSLSVSRSIQRSHFRPDLDRDLHSASPTKLSSPPRSVSQRPPRQRKPRESGSGLVSWSDAVKTIQEDDPELHAGILEDVGIFEQYDDDGATDISDMKLSQRSASIELGLHDVPEISSRINSPILEGGLASKKSPSESFFDLTANPSDLEVAHLPSTSAEIVTQEVFHRNVVDPSHYFSDDEDGFNLPRVSWPQQPILVEPEPTADKALLVPPNSSPVNQVDSPLAPNREAKRPTEAAELGNSKGNTKSAHDFTNHMTSSNLASRNTSTPKAQERAARILKTRPADTSKVPPSAARQPPAKNLPCPHIGCSKLFTNSWNLKSHLRYHERMEAQALEMATPARSAFLDWDDFDELSLGPDDFILVSARSKHRRHKNGTPLAIRLRRESNATIDSISKDRPESTKKLSVDETMDDVDELAIESYAITSTAQTPQLAPLNEPQPRADTQAQDTTSEELPELASLFHPAESSEPISVAKQMPTQPTTSSSSTVVRKSRYSGDDVYEVEVNGITVMRRCEDAWLNATQILRVAGLDISQRHEVLRDSLWSSDYKQIHGVQKYQGTWIPFERGLKLCQEYKLDELLGTLLVSDLATEVALPPDRPTSSHTINNHKRKFGEMAADELPSQRKTVIEDSAAESSELSFIPGSSPSRRHRLRSRRDTTGITAMQPIDLDSPKGRGQISNLMVLITPAKRERRRDPVLDKDRSARESSVVKTPGGTLRRCGLDGFRCKRSFCFKCASPNKLDA
ncbi:start control protein Cdc10 [Phlyctema vagabunda]|uniref:Start control protein Cdc10 n=1 Tax=Phlyctema vagabunda TaxID=108571 RepID=A0ABR4PFW2_9HELO